MATLEQLETALRNADKAGDMNAARKLAVIVKAERDRRNEADMVVDPATGKRVKLAPIPGQWDNAQVAGTSMPGVPTDKPTSIGEKILGTGESALSVASSIPAAIVAPLVGMTKGIKDQIVTGGHALDGGKDEAAELADSVAKAMTYAPRTQTGQKIVGKFGELAEPLVALGPMGAELGVVGESASALKPVARAAVSERVVSPIKAAANTLAEQVVAKIAPGAEAVSTPGTGQSAGAAAVDMAQIRQAAAQELPVPIKLTEGQKTRAFEQQRFERETAKQGDIGEPIRQRFQEQNLKLQQNMDAFIDSTGAELTEARGVGEIVDKALRQRAARDKTKIRTLYKEAEKAGEMKEPVPMDPVNTLLNESSSAESLAPVIGATRKEMARLAELNPEGNGALSLGQAENLRKFVTKVAGTDKTNLKYANEIKAAIDTATEGKGGELYKQARAAYAQSMADYENFGLARNLLKAKRGSTDRAVALEDVLRKSVVSPSASADSVMKLKQLLITEGETGTQAWKELQGGLLRHIRDEALKNVARDSAGNPIVSAAGLDRVITGLDKTGKLEMVLGKKQAEQLRTINEVAKDVLTAPPGVVNTSNTATVLAGLIDVGVSGMSGVPLPIATAAKQVISRVKDARLRARVKSALGE